MVLGYPEVSSWLLLRGLTRESRHWGNFPQLLQAAQPDTRMVAIDLPGSGGLHTQTSPLRIEDIADQCRGQAGDLGLSPPYNIVALSLGAMVAVAWANAHPDEVASCVLINTSLRPFNRFHRRLRPGRYPSLLRLLLPMSDRARETLIFRMTSNRTEDRERIVDDWVAIHRTHPLAAANALRQLVAAARYRAPAERPTPRMLILASLGDRLVHPECSRQLARAWQTDFAEHPTAGHDLPLDDGAWVTQQIGLWCAKEPYHHG
jgi:pimeloyl-ACP methyl ester carboxylesterase